MANCEVTPVNTTFEGWKSDVAALDSMNNAPDALNAYIEYIEQETGVPIDIVSIGPDRKQTLFRD